MPLDFGGAQLLEIPEQAVARVVDQNVDASVRLHRSVDRRVRLRFIGDVQLDERKVTTCDIVQSLTDLVEIAARRDHTIAGIQGRSGGCGADAAARTRDEPDLAHAWFLSGQLEGQLAQRLAGQPRDGVGEGGRQRRQAGLADAGRRIGAGHDVDGELPACR